MRFHGNDLPDWRVGEQYTLLRTVGRAELAWEWLRRDKGYLSAAAECRPGDRAHQWGLHRFEPPHRDSMDARPLWRRSAYPFVLEADAEDTGPPGERFDIGRFDVLANVADCDGAERLLLSNGRRSIRVDILSGTLRRGPVLLRYRLSGLGCAEPPLQVLRQLLFLSRAGEFSNSLHPKESRADRWVLLLRTHDALSAGAGQRAIASLLLDQSASEPRWRIAAPSLRSRVQRLVRDARSMASGGYRALLAGT